MIKSDDGWLKLWTSCKIKWQRRVMKILEDLQVWETTFGPVTLKDLRLPEEQVLIKFIQSSESEHFRDCSVGRTEVQVLDWWYSTSCGFFTENNRNSVLVLGRSRSDFRVAQGEGLVVSPLLVAPPHTENYDGKPTDPIPRQSESGELWLADMWQWDLSEII